jgi:hypothetical protein
VDDCSRYNRASPNCLASGMAPLSLPLKRSSPWAASDAAYMFE